MTILNPSLTLDPKSFVEIWRHEEIRVVCLRPPVLEDHPDLPVRIRGALGRILADMPPPMSYRHDPFNRPRAFPYLFGDAATARPLAIACDIVGRELTVTISLFGSARIWSDQVREALLQALTEGISMRTEGRVRYPLKPIDCMVRTTSAAPPSAVINQTTFRFLSPVAVRDGARLSASPASLLWAMITRIRNLAGWFGVSLEEDWAELHKICLEARVNDSTLLPIYFRRYSQRQRDRRIPMMGFVGTIRMEGDLSRLAAFLTLSNYTHIGSHAALGFGRTLTITYA
ncbi:CRISPR system precrRNA processing endoribonuclease RAMP protein Cas6 [Rhabdaerophilum sp. SD176]|uniref:CRISPR system precrRNA processing endoribonuclease RAMP protein Cas6 n=1 Tax=Rhabdaerophilum sp. SD176 TaxID=2983548 RepID=UPI0024DF9AF3|nr:CRISPR system precrRNA processing endoribonuclease RAMP protein Cas6 [Rhabdaerophilum sp. SD176]